MQPSSDSLYAGSLFATREAVQDAAGHNGEVMEAPDPSVFYRQGASDGRPSTEIVAMQGLARLTIQMYDRLRQISPQLTDDELRERMLPMPCGKLASLNETLFAFCTCRDRVDMREKFIETLLIRARLEAGELTPERAKIQLSNLMGMDASARARLRLALSHPEQSSS